MLAPSKLRVYVLCQVECVKGFEWWSQRIEYGLSELYTISPTTLWIIDAWQCGWSNINYIKRESSESFLFTLHSFWSGSNKLIYSNLCASIIFPSLLTNFLARIMYNLFLFSFFGLSNESIAKYVNNNKSNLDLFPYELQIYVCYVINNIFINAYFTFLFAIDHRLSISFIEYFSLISPRRTRIASFEWKISFDEWKTFT